MKLDRWPFAAYLLGVALHGCGPRPAPGAIEAGAVADSTWSTVTGPTIIAFHPRATNEQIEADEGLATVLDDLAYHLGSAIPGLDSIGVAVQYQAGDTVKLLAPDPATWVRNPDSADVGYLFVDPRGSRAELYGVRTDAELLQLARGFVRTGRLTQN